jgi:D-alanyl-D-alanine carboxypeptidase/D-alanyl-D-alanine-endopeptidase (penicillin-binding protein 4)
LIRDIDAILAQPALQHGYWGVLVKSLANDDTLYAMNARKLLLPASTMKIVTLAVAAEKLGWDYRYETTIRAAGPIEAGVLRGDLVVSGTGDPGLVAADGMGDRVFADWAGRLKQRGIRTIAGRIIGDDNRFDEDTLGAGWMWDDLPDDYAAGVGALQFNEGAVRLTIAPGPAAGDSAAISVAPAGSGLTVVNAVATGGARQPRVDRHAASARQPDAGGPRIDRGRGVFVHAHASVDNPTLFFAGALRSALIANGIDVPRPGGGHRRRAGRAACGSRSPRFVPISPAFSLALRLMKASQNQYAETF